MIKRILELKNDIAIVLLRLPSAPAVLTLEETLVLQDLIEIMSCFDDATKKVSGDYVTISLIIPLVYGIYNHLINLQPSTSEGKIILQNIVESVKTRLFPYEERTFTRLATVLDPRLKKEAFRSIRSSDNAKCAVSLLQSEMSLKESLLPQRPEENHDTTEAVSNSGKSLFDFLNTRIAEKSKNRTVTANSIIYLREYMERPNTNNDMDPLIFWNVNNDSLGTLATCAKKILWAPASSVPSERIFSKAGIIVSDRRSRIKAKNVDMLIFLNQNDWLL